MEKTLGERIKARRKMLKLTQKEVARAVGVSTVAVTQWESDMQVPKSDNSEALSRALNTSWQWLRYGSDAMDDATQGQAASYKPVPIIDKASIATFLRGEAAPAGYGSAKAASIRDALGGSNETFVFIETIDGMKPKISAGDTVFIDPLDKNPAPGTAIWLFNTPSGPFLGAIKETPRGIMLHFDNSTPGWEPIPVTKDDCLGKLVAFLPVWLGDLNNAIRNLV